MMLWPYEVGTGPVAYGEMQRFQINVSPFPFAYFSMMLCELEVRFIRILVGFMCNANILSFSFVGFK